MEYTISQASKLLNVSRVTIYKKINKIKGLQPHIIIKSNAKYIDSNGIELIRQSLIDNQQNKPLTSIKEEENKPLTSEEEEKPPNEDTSSNLNEYKDVYYLEESINNLKQQIDDLKHDKEKLYSIIESEKQLHQNTQILLKESQQRLLADVQEVNNDNVVVNSKSKLNPLQWFRWTKT